MAASLPEQPQHRRDWSRLNQWLLWLGLAAAVAWLLWRHGAHVVEVLPFLLILACPLLHLFGHGSHRHGSRPHDSSADPHSHRG